MPSAPIDSLAGHAIFASSTITGSCLSASTHCRDDPQRLVHLLDAQLVAGEGVGGGVRRDLEVVLLVAEVGVDLAQVPGQARRAQDRPGDAEAEAPVEREVADPDEALLPDRVAGEQLVEAGQARVHDVAELEDALLGALGEDPGPRRRGG